MAETFIVKYNIVATTETIYSLNFDTNILLDTWIHQVINNNVLFNVLYIRSKDMLVNYLMKSQKTYINKDTFNGIWLKYGIIGDGNPTYVIEPPLFQSLMDRNKLLISN